MTDKSRSLEERLAALTGRRYAVLTSRATAALYLAFRALDRAGSRIVLPAILCPSPAYAALYAGYRLAFCDVEPETGNISVSALERLLADTPDVVAVLTTHLYGQPAKMAAICEVAERAGVTLIEDGAQALGATMPDGSPMGRYGICSVLSFGHTKIVDVGYGGALVSDDQGLVETIRRTDAKLATSGKDRARLSAEFRSEYYRIRAAAEIDPAANEEFLGFPGRYRSLYLDSFDEPRIAGLGKALDGLAANLDARRRKAAIYDEILATAALDPLRRDPGAAPWRYGVRVRGNEQKRVTKALRDAGFDSSNWYPSLHRWFEESRRQDESLLKNACTHEEAILNLWLDNETDEARVKACAEALADLVSGGIIARAMP
jgi:dTDP-4-amino-4,6-dideoxygalactose transaminase